MRNTRSQSISFVRIGADDLRGEKLWIRDRWHSSVRPAPQMLARCPFRIMRGCREVGRSRASMRFGALLSGHQASITRQAAEAIGGRRISIASARPRLRTWWRFIQFDATAPPSRMAPLVITLSEPRYAFRLSKNNSCVVGIDRATFFRP
jgi:hypothetical protein